MGRRSEPRIAISFPVTVRGFDLQGHRFSVNAQTRDISGSGASLEGVGHLVQPGKKIEIEFGNQSAWYSVEWAAKNGSSRSGRVGVRCLERKYIWDIPAKPAEPDTYRDDAPPLAQASAAAIPGKGGERRKYPRRSCRLEAQISDLGSSSRVRGTVTDLSLGGCYVEMLAPLPMDSGVELAIDLEGEDLFATGKVRTSQTGFGMGVTFSSLSPGDFERLRRFVPPEAASAAASGTAVQRQPCSQPAPEFRRDRSRSPSAVALIPSATSSGAEDSAAMGRALEAVVRALVRKGILSREDLAEEFEKVGAARR
jgi:PilZ domain